MIGRFERFDARPGGGYRLVLAYADASAATGKTTAGSDVVEVTFVDIVPGARVVQAVDFVSDDPASRGPLPCHGRSPPLNPGEMKFRADGVPSGISAHDHGTGLASSLANLAAYVEQ